jgi:Tfp pilus assembly protein PilN
MANNFIEEDNKNKLKKNLDFAVNQKEEVKWTEPVPDNSMNTKEKIKSYSSKSSSNPLENEKNNVKASPPSQKKQAKILTEEKHQSFFEKIFSNFKKEEPESFQKQKKDLSKHQEDIEQEEDLKNNSSSLGQENHKDIGEVVKEKLKENKIEISDGSILKTNLMDGGPTFLVDWRKNFLFLGLGLFIVALVIGVLYGFLLIKKQNESMEGEELSQEIEIIQMQIEKEKSNLSDIDKLQKKLLISKDILDKHIYWTNFFKFLEDNTLENVYYSNGVSGNTDGEYTFESFTDNYRNITEQLLVLKNSDLVLEAEVTQGSMEEKEKKDEEEKNIQEKQTQFSLSLKLAPEIFYK